MRLVRVAVSHFGSIRSASVAFGPGLNVLYGPNDLGKSTLAEAIRLALLLPSTSTAHEAWIPWTGAHKPTVELVFQAADRFWQVRKEFGPGNAATLRKSVDDVNWDEVARGRAVDAEIRALLNWGIAEPGGNAPKGLGSSFLATALLSTQSDVGAVLEASLANDSADGGKLAVSAALQALAQDPLFTKLIDEANAHYDRAFTAQGRKKGAAGGVLKVAAERVKQAREACDAAVLAASDTASVASSLRTLGAAARDARDAAGEATEAVAHLKRLRVGWLARERDAARATRDQLSGALADADAARQLADDALAAAEKAATGGDDDGAAALSRVRLEAAIASAIADDRLIATRRDAALAHSAVEVATAASAAHRAEVAALDDLERAVVARALQAAEARLAGERAARADLQVPAPGALAALRKLENEHAVARAKLAVGLAVSVDATGEVRIGADGAPASLHTGAVAIEARTSVEVVLPGVATVRVAAGSADARENAKKLAERWAREAAPVLGDAGVLNLEALSELVDEAARRDQAIARGEVERGHLADERAKLGGADPAVDLGVLVALGADPRAAVRARRAAAQQTGPPPDLGPLHTRAALAAQAVAQAETSAAEAQTRLESAGGVAQPVGAARAALAALDGGIAERKRAVEAALSGARAGAKTAAAHVAALRQQHQEAVARVATREGQLAALGGEAGDEAREVSDAELAAAVDRAAGLAREATRLEAELHRAQGALEQVGGAVAEEKRVEAEEALALAEQQEAAIEAEYDAWKLLRETLVAAEQAQASHLGQAFTPGLSEQFAALTGGRYGALALSSHLATEGISVHGAVRDVDRLSVGTREQLSTLYRLCLAERLGSAVVLDDQLVQSDVHRLAWFRSLLFEKARQFQIVVLTCRPEDYAGGDAVTRVDLGAQITRALPG